MRIGSGPNDEGASRYHLIRECERSLKRLCADHIDIYIHEWDGVTPVEEKLAALDVGAAGQGALRRLFELFRLANYEIAGRVRPRPPPALCYPLDSLTLEAREAEYERCRFRSIRGLAFCSGVRLPPVCCRASTAAASPLPKAPASSPVGQNR